MTMQRAVISILLLWLGIASCGDAYESTIPSVSFSFSCNLAQSPYYKLKTPGQFLKVEKNVNGLPVGYAGLIIGQSVFSDGNSYVAFDAACPVESKKTVSLMVVDDGLGTAECPKCHATYSLSNNGFRSDNGGSEVLRSYKVQVSGNTLRIYN